MRNKSKSSEKPDMKSKKSDLLVGKKSVPAESKKSDLPVGNKSADPNVNMMNRFSRPASEMMGSHHESIHGQNALRGHNHGGGANNGGKDGNLRYDNSAITKRRDVDGDMTGGSKGKN